MWHIPKSWLFGIQIVLNVFKFFSIIYYLNVWIREVSDSFMNFEEKLVF